MALEIGSRLGPYEITGSLGAGGMGEVYRATATELRRDVALKVLPDEVARDDERSVMIWNAHDLSRINVVTGWAPEPE
jgi:serine/threonine protein kinase